MSEGVLNHVATGGAIAVTPELLEQLYGARARQTARKPCANPGPT